jgi:hypothetical protein
MQGCMQDAPPPLKAALRWCSLAATLKHRGGGASLRLLVNSRPIRKPPQQVQPAAGAEAGTACCQECTFNPHANTVLPTVPQTGGEGATGKQGMPCTTCLHPTCPHAPSQQAMAACPNCASIGITGEPASAARFPPPSRAALRDMRNATGECWDAGAQVPAPASTHLYRALPAAVAGGGP